MAAPGIGVGDIIAACQKIYELCIKYRDSVSEFDEIADKSRATEVVLERIDRESLVQGNLVQRAGPEAYDQLQDNLKSLRKDSKKLRELVQKYAKIHTEGPGRRLLWALKESNNLNDLRRRIAYHEQMLQIWYMTLVYGSLRRIEGGQEDMIQKLADLDRAIKKMKSWSPRKREAVRESLRRGDTRTLETELRKAGIEAEAVEATLDEAVQYAQAPPREQAIMEEEVNETLADCRKRRTDDSIHTGDEPFTFASKRYEVPPPFTRFSTQAKGTDRSAKYRLAKPSPHPHSNARFDELIDMEPRRRGADQEARHGIDGHEPHSGRAKAEPRYRSTVIVDSDDEIPIVPLKGILKRSRSTSSRPQFPHAPANVPPPPPSPSPAREYVRPVLRVIEPPPPRPAHRLPIRSGYPSVRETGRVREDVFIVPNSARADRRARHNSEVPPFRPIGVEATPVYQLNPRSPGSGGGSGARLEIPLHSHEYRSRSMESRGYDNSGGGGFSVRPQTVELVQRVERRPSTEHGAMGGAADSEEVLIVRRPSRDRRPSDDRRQATHRPSPGSPRLADTTAQASVTPRRPSNTDKHARVEDAVDEDAAR